MSIDDPVHPVHDPGNRPDVPDRGELRSRADTSLQRRRDIMCRRLVYLIVNTFRVVIWAVASGPDGFFWPVFPLVGWGIGVVMNAWDVYRPEELVEDVIEAVMRRLEK